MEITTWANKIEKLIECPVCFEITDHIFLCQLGHNICDPCSLRVRHCPLCKHPLTKIRNYCAESLVKIFDDLKKDSNNFEMNFKKMDLSDTKRSLIKLGASTTDSWGIFPCVIGTCIFQGCYNTIIKHFKQKHPTMFKQMSDSTLPVTQSWKLTVEKCEKLIYNGFLIKDTGFFVFHLNINKNGYMRGTLLMYASRLEADKFSYHFEVTNGKKKWNFKTQKIQTCKIPLKTIYETCLCIPPEEILGTNNIQPVPITCTVSLTRNISR